jgi:hypothetical protein
MYQVAEGAKPNIQPFAGLDPMAGSGTNLNWLILLGVYWTGSCPNPDLQKKRRQNQARSVYFIRKDRVFEENSRFVG